MIGVVTSPTGAVIRDILHRLADRFPRRVLVWPVRVQGEASAAEVADAIRGFNALPERGPLPRPDLIIVARGGGSLEDLWSFNEEIVVRAAAESMIPLISAVGHETDVTLIDFAADRRAPTPTAAAEMAVPVRTELIGELISTRRAARSPAGSAAMEHAAHRTAGGGARAAGADELLAVPRQRLDACAERLPRALIANAQMHHRQLTRVAARLSPRLLRSATDARAAKSSSHSPSARARATRVYLERRAQRLRSAGQLLAAFSYRGVLARGFALVRDGAGHPLRSAAAVAGGMRLDIEFSDGRVGGDRRWRRAGQNRTEARAQSRPQAAPARR